MVDAIELPPIDVTTVGAAPGSNGVPDLLAGGDVETSSPTDLLSADVLIGLPLQFSQQWGVFLNGTPVVIFDTFVSIDYRQTWNLSDYPVEQGGFESYNKVYTPFETRVSFATGGSEGDRAAMLASVAAIAGTLQLFTVVTPEAVYQSVNVKHYDYHRTATNGVGLITVDLWLEEVRVTVSESGTTAGTSANASGNEGGSASAASGLAAGSSNFTNTVDPSGANPNNDGVVQPYYFPGL